MFLIKSKIGDKYYFYFDNFLPFFAQKRNTLNEIIPMHHFTKIFIMYWNQRELYTCEKPPQSKETRIVKQFNILSHMKRWEL